MAIEYLKKGLDEKQRIEDNDKVKKIVEETLSKIESEGDKHIRELSQKFDNYSPDSFRLSEDQINQLMSEVSDDDKEDIKFAQKQVRSFAEAQLKTLSELEVETHPGVILGHKNIPVQAVGCYVPAGKFPMVASAHMSVVTASVAGVPRIVATTPPFKGKPNPAVVTAMKMGGAHEIYVLGGMQGVGAMAIGTETIKPVDMLVGPGNAFVAEAKRQVFGKVGIDSFAGPSEIMIVCDREETPVEYLVRDLLSQAEHDPEAGAILVTTSRDQAENVKNRLQELVPTLPRREIIEESFASRSALIVCDSKEECFDAVNEMAPEHLELLTEDPFQDLHRVRNAGAIFVGPNTPEAVGDYFAGPNHTLPTSGCAKFASPLGVQDFTKSSSVLAYSEERLQREGSAIIRFAEEEKLYAHAESIRVRMKTTE